MRNRRVRSAKDDIRVDVNHLEDEVVEHPGLYMYYSDLLADAIEEKDIAKQQLELKYSVVESNIRKNWDLHFEEKPTEPAIKGKILQDSTYKKAQNALIKANKTVNVLKGVVNSFEHRKKAIEQAVSLRIGGFYSEPRKRKRQVERKGGTTTGTGLKKRIKRKRN